MKPFWAEVLGTFCLVFAGCGAIVIDTVEQGSVTHVGVALTFGLIVMAMIYALGDISGAHLNPAVTVGFWLAGRFRAHQVGPYVAAQVLGAVAACGLLALLFGRHTAQLGATLPSGDWWQSFVLEIVLTWMLMFVILSVSSGAREKGLMAGAAIGGLVALEAMFAGPISGASMNPARSLGPALVSGNVQHVWLYLAGPLIGAALAVSTWSCLRPSDAVAPSSEKALTP